MTGPEEEREIVIWSNQLVSGSRFLERERELLYCDCDDWLKRKMEI